VGVRLGDARIAVDPDEPPSIGTSMSPLLPDLNRRCAPLVGIAAGGDGMNRVLRFMRDRWVEQGLLADSSMVPNSPSARR
jgi:hypothetical protein